MKQKPRRRDRERSHLREHTGSPALAHGGLLSILVSMCVAGLFIVRFLLPTEGTAQGDTLLITQFWFGVLLLWAWNSFREQTSTLRLGWLDGAAAAIVVGHVISALVVITTAGDKRSAMNYLWEWLSLGVTFFLLRQLLADKRHAKAMLLTVMILITTLAGLGLWQHYVWYPQAQQDYTARRSELDQLTDAPSRSRLEAQRLQELQSQFHQQNIPLEGPSRMLWEQRLNASSEPFGTFALANTFAGVLIVGFLLLAGTVHQRKQEDGSLKDWFLAPSTLLLLASLSLVGYCLLLTKSRTAWVGLMAGATVYGWQQLRLRQRLPGVWLVGGLLGLILIALGIAGLSGGFDQEVISEAPRSLKFRLQYWTATAEVIRDNTLLGTGPGNFRQHYLGHKLPAASEEITDPHNLLLDLWTSGGLLAAIGFFCVLLVATWRFSQGKSTPAPENNATASEPPLSLTHPIFLGVLSGFVCLLLFQLIFSANGDSLRLLALMAGASALGFGLLKTSSITSVSLTAVMAAAVALTVHLTGAGGIEMPAVVQLFLLLLALPVSHSEEIEETETVPLTPVMTGVISVLALTMFLGCLLTATRPVLSRQLLMREAEWSQSQGHPATKVFTRYKEAAAADPLSPEPWQRLGDLYFLRWQAGFAGNGVTTDRFFQQGVSAWKEAIERNPRSPNGYRQLGYWYTIRFEHKSNPRDAQLALEALSNAVERYPHLAQLRADRAFAYDAAQQPDKALAEAKVALELNRINHQEGHRDKQLSEEIVDRLQKLQ